MRLATVELSMVVRGRSPSGGSLLGLFPTARVALFVCYTALGLEHVKLSAFVQPGYEQTPASMARVAAYVAGRLVCFVHGWAADAMPSSADIFATPIRKRSSIYNHGHRRKEQRHTEHQISLPIIKRLPFCRMI
jgi:hypothetical protein